MSRSPAPFLMPPPPAPFVGRSQALEQLAQAVGRRQRVLITGPGGAIGCGKSALARAFAHALRDAFPDGVLWMRGDFFDPYLYAVRIALALGIDPGTLASPGEARPALEKLLQGRRLLLVLDDIGDARSLNLMPLVGPAIVATSREPGIARSARVLSIELGGFQTADLEALFQQRLGLDRWRLEPVAARDLANLLQAHPLALHLALARVSAELPPSGPAISLATRELRSRLAQLQRFGGERRWVGAAFAYAYDGLSPEDRALLHSVVVLPTVGFSAEAAAAVVGLPLEQTRQSLERLIQRGFLESLGTDRYVMGELVAESARTLGPLEENRRRAAGFYLSLMLSHSEQPTTIDRDIEGILVGMATALELGEAEMVRDFALGLGPYFDARGFTEEVPRRLQLGVAAARHTHDLRAEGRLNRWLGRLFLRRGAAEAARERLDAALSLAAESGDRAGQASTLLDLGRLLGEDGRLDQAIAAFERVLTLTRGRLSEEGPALLELARLLLRAGRTGEALKGLEACLAWAARRQEGSLEAEARRLLAELETLRAQQSGLDGEKVLAGLEEISRRRRSPLPPVHAPLPDGPQSAPAEPTPAQVLQRLAARSAPLEVRDQLEQSLLSGELEKQLEATETLASVLAAQGEVREGEAALLRGAELAARSGVRIRAADLIEQAGRMLVSAGEVDGALRHYERSFRLREAEGEQGAAARTLHQMGRTATEAGDYDSALFHFLRGLERQEALSDRSGKAEALFRLGVIFSARGDTEEALSHYEAAEELWLEARDLSGLAAVLQARGRILAHTGDRDGALRCYARSIELAEGLADERLKAAGLHQLGLLEVDGGNFDAGMNHYRRSLGIKRGVGDLQSMAVTLHAMAQLEAVQGRGAEALQYHERVLEIARELNNTRVAAATHRAIGDVHTAAGRSEQALLAYQAALELQVSLGEKHELAAIHHGIGTCQTDAGHIDAALAALNRSLELAQELRDIRMQAANLYQLGMARAELGQEEEAVGLLQRSLELDEQSHNRRGVAITRAMLGQLLSVLGRSADGLSLMRDALQRMKTLQMPEAAMVAEWLEGQS